MASTLYEIFALGFVSEISLIRSTYRSISDTLPTGVKIPHEVISIFVIPETDSWCTRGNHKLWRWTSPQ